METQTESTWIIQNIRRREWSDTIQMEFEIKLRIGYAIKAKNETEKKRKYEQEMNTHSLIFVGIVYHIAVILWPMEQKKYV